VYVKFPYGVALGEPGNADQQRTILKALFDALVSVEQAGTIIELPYRWRRERYEPTSFRKPDAS